MALTNCYATVDDLRSELGATNTDHLARLERAISAASRQIDAHTGWTRCGFWQTAATQRYYEPENTRCLYVPEGLVSVGGISVDYDGDGVYEVDLAGSDYRLEPYNASEDWPARPWTEVVIMPLSSAYFPLGLGNTVKLDNSVFGWPAIPDDVNKACLIQAAQLFKSTDAVFGGVQLGLDGSVLRVRQSMNPMAEALLEGYSKPRVA